MERNAPSASGCDGAGFVAFRAVLRKSGKVTNVKLTKSIGGCTKFEERALKTVENAKFKPATIEGTPVSMYFAFEFTYNCHGSCP